MRDASKPQARGVVFGSQVIGLIRPIITKAVLITGWFLLKKRSVVDLCWHIVGGRIIEGGRAQRLHLPLILDDGHFLPR
jgi:hypothetical protein